MKAVAIFKWAPNPDDALVRVDGTVNWSTARHDVVTTITPRWPAPWLRLKAMR